MYYYEIILLFYDKIFYQYFIINIFEFNEE